MNILLIPSEQFIPAHEPLAGTFQNDQAKILVNAGYEVGVISVQLKFSLPMIVKAILFRMAGKKPANATREQSFAGLFRLGFNKLFKPHLFVKKESANGIPVYRAEGFYLKAPDPANDYHYWIKAGLQGFELYLKDNGRPDVIHAHNAINAGILALAIKKKYGIPYMLTEHSSYYSRNLYDAALLPKAKKVFEEAAVATAVSPFLAACLNDIFPSAVQWQVLPNVAEPLFEKRNLVNKPDSGLFTFLHIANLIPLKRQALLIEAFHEAFDKKDKVTLEFAGEGESLDELQKLVQKLGENDRIKFHGLLSKEDIFKKLDEVQVVCLPSSYETFGVAVLEAIIRGVPVVASRCGGPDQMVNSNNGLLVNVDDKAGLKAALVNIKNNYTQYDATVIRKEAIEKYGSGSFLKKLDSYYRQIMN